MKIKRRLIKSLFGFSALSVFLIPVTASLQASELEQAILQARQDVEEETRRLNRLRERISGERRDLVSTIRALEAEVAGLRTKAAGYRQAKFYRNAGFDQLKDDVQYLRQEVDYASSQIADFRRSMMRRMHGSEEQRFGETLGQIDTMLDSPEKGAALEAFKPLLSLAQQRNEENFGGHAFPGKAADEAGHLRKGHYLLAGPIAWFLGADEKVSGLAAIKTGSAYPAVNYRISAKPLAALLEGKEAEVPLDVTLGEAVQMEAAKKNWWEHVRSGGVIMVPILMLGLLSLVIAVWKLRVLSRVRGGVEQTMPGLFEKIQAGRVEEAAGEARSLGEPWGPVLTEGVRHHHIPIEHLEEILHEKTLSQIPYLERNLSILAASAAASPLLGLLGTVTGMIHTFDLVAVFGTGKANLLSAGISEALVTTEFGLIIAIPALLAHAYLSRRVQGILHQMEQMNAAFINGLKMERFRRFNAKEESLL